MGIDGKHVPHSQDPTVSKIWTASEGDLSKGRYDRALQNGNWRQSHSWYSKRKQCQKNAESGRQPLHVVAQGLVVLNCQNPIMSMHSSHLYVDTKYVVPPGQLKCCWQQVSSSVVQQNSEPFEKCYLRGHQQVGNKYIAFKGGFTRPAHHSYGYPTA